LELIISGRHAELTEALTNYAKEKFGKLERYFDGILSMEAILKVEKNAQIVEAVARVQGGKEIVAEASQPDMYAAIDVAEDKLMRQLKKHKERLHSKGKDSSRITRR
jgi:putative sigma-54 modulation protein